MVCTLFGLFAYCSSQLVSTFGAWESRHLRVRWSANWFSEKIGVFLYCTAPRWLESPPSFLFGEDWGLVSLELKWPESESVHSRPSTTGVKNAWSCTATPHTSSCRCSWVFAVTLAKLMSSWMILMAGLCGDGTETLWKQGILESAQWLLTAGKNLFTNWGS